MAAIPDVTTTITDGALGLVDTNARVSAAVGVCSAGTANTLYAISDPSDIKTKLGSGPLCEYVAHVLAVGGGTVIACPVNPSVAGTAGAVSKVGTGLSVLTITGAPVDTFDAKVQIVQGGTNPAAGTATFKYTLDGGDTYSPELALPTSGVYAVPDAGISLNFSAASLVAGDVYSFATVQPGYSGSDLTAALNALTADPRTWKFVHIGGAPSTASAQATIVGTVNGLMVAAATAHRDAYAIMHLPDLGDGTAGDAASIAAFASVVAPYVAVGAGFAEVVSSISGRAYKRPASWPFAARRHLAAIHEDAGRVRSGALPGVTKLWRDERVNSGLDSQRFVTLRTIVGKQGYYVTNGNMMAATGSDFGLVQRREVINVATTIGYAAEVEYLNDDLFVNAASNPTNPGAIREQDARGIESVVRGKLAAALLAPGSVSDVQVTVNRTDNILSTQTVRTRIRVLPKAYAKYITAEIGFENPALNAS